MRTATFTKPGFSFSPLACFGWFRWPDRLPSHSGWIVGHTQVIETRLDGLVMGSRLAPVKSRVARHPLRMRYMS